jgi:hypothetical protein
MINMIEGKIYIVLVIISFAGTLCYFVGFVISLIIVGVILTVYIIYAVYGMISMFQKMHPV